ncbi:hypothetical protein [Streptomyces sp. B4I13]|uniref:hypothetical protein n=1 Tax=Streptomyces sp. B4I13 TaxID=3042271 RepID=UPI0027D8192E|nr:hypothetical protein [Streptomyces sp. B4I13]
MGTSLTPEFWKMFTVLLLGAAMVTFALTAALDTVYVRMQLRRARRQRGQAPTPPPRPQSSAHPPLARL